MRTLRRLAAVGLCWLSLLADPLCHRADVDTVLGVRCGGAVHRLIKEQISAARALRGPLVGRRDVPILAAICCAPAAPLRSSCVGVSRTFTVAGSAEETPHHLGLHDSHSIVVQQHAVTAAAHDGDVVTSGRIPADVNHHTAQLEEPARRLLGRRLLALSGRRACGCCLAFAAVLVASASSVLRRSRELAPHGSVLNDPQLQREDYAIGKSAATAQALYVLESLQVQGQDTRELIDPQSLLCLLQAAASAAEELIPSAKQLSRFKSPETSSNRGVPLNVHTEI
mmetsp:Transcript_60703/g.131539  ORF Transcript_60703/g.131539 Transcript_60703/m.131539 type:complete len:283 (+) Transcript_60703:302-1150(+)